MKVIAFYLPQFHSIPENDKWWGEGFTDWVNVKKAIPLDPRQRQPRIPLNYNYYDLSDIAVMKWQADLATRYGIFGFCIYHYWFNGHKLLEKPAENLLKNTDINISFCFCWANENWTNQWSAGVSQKMLLEQTYGTAKEWKHHFNYLLPFFKDKRYIKNGGKPFFVIYRPDLINCLDEMLHCWNECAIENGFTGICFAYQKADQTVFNYANGTDKDFDYQIEYQPLSCARWQQSKIEYIATKVKRQLFRKMNCFFHTNKFSTIVYQKKLLAKTYDKDWECIVTHKPESPKCIPGAFVDWDNTPRKQLRGSFYEGASPEKFAVYFNRLIKWTKEIYKKDMIFIFAWNEWAEGGYLEPDEEYGYGYLEAIHEALKKNNELPEK